MAPPVFPPTPPIPDEPRPPFTNSNGEWEKVNDTAACFTKTLKALRDYSSSPCLKALSKYGNDFWGIKLVLKGS